MTLKTLPVFYYGFEVLPECNWVDFREGEFGNEISFQLDVGVYTAEELRSLLQDGLNAVGEYVYTVTFDRFTRKYTILTEDYFELLLGTGTHADSSLLKCIGFSSYSVWGEGHLYGDPYLTFGDVDTGLFTIHQAKFPAGFSWDPQYLIQDYLDAENNESLRSPSVQESTAGDVEVIHFGLDKIYEFNFKYITDLEMPCGGPIRNDQDAVAKANSFFKWAVRRKVIEYMPDKNNTENYVKIRLEKLKGSNTATSYQLTEMTKNNMPEFFETGKVTFRRLD